jgi:TonB family protein
MSGLLLKISLMRSLALFTLLLASTSLIAQDSGADNTPTKVFPCVGKHPKQPCAIPPSVISSPGPDFSTSGHEKRVEGEIYLDVVVGVDGRVHDVRITKPLGPGLDEKAIEAVKRWTFKPGTLNGKPVAVKIQVQVDFHRS